MQRYVARKNVERYRTLLDAEQDAVRRATLRSLLEEEERKLNALDGVLEGDPATGSPG